MWRTGASRPDPLDGAVGRTVVADDDSKIRIVEAKDALETLERVAPAVVVDEQDVYAWLTVH